MDSVVDARPRLSERDSRRTGWAIGVPIPLGNGEEWHFPRPQVGMRAHPRPDGTVVMRRSSRTFGPDYADQVEELMAGRLPEHEIFSRTATMAVQLLRANYDLDDAAVGELFSFDLDDDFSDRWIRLRELVFGLAPKP